MPSLQSLSDIVDHHTDAEAALRHYFSANNPDYAVRFATYRPSEVDAKFIACLKETDLRSSLITLARIEAALRVDYQARCRLKLADDVSIKFRRIYRARKEKARLDDDIINTWRDHIIPSDRAAISSLRSMFKFRHWLAHGRHWNFAPQHSFQDIYQVADAIFTSLPLHT